MIKFDDPSRFAFNTELFEYQLFPKDNVMLNLARSPYPKRLMKAVTVMSSVKVFLDVVNFKSRGSQ